ncbi:hypothetical protein CBL_05232 [Carabus blaptoides fortunei]
MMLLLVLVLARPKDEKLQSDTSYKSENTTSTNQTVTSKTTQNTTTILSNNVNANGTLVELNATTSLYSEELTTVINYAVPIPAEPASVPLIPNGIYSSEEIVICGSANSSEIIVPMF